MQALRPLFLIYVAKITCLGTGVRAKNIKANDFSDDWMVDIAPLGDNKEVELESFIKEERERIKRETNKEFGLKALAAPDDDYYEKGGDGDGEDYFEKSEWSDVYRSAHGVKHTTIKLDHPDLVDIEGIGVQKLGTDHKNRGAKENRKGTKDYRIENKDNQKERQDETKDSQKEIGGRRESRDSHEVRRKSDSKKEAGKKKAKSKINPKKKTSKPKRKMPPPVELKMFR